MVGWDTVCSRIMNKQLSIWDGILRTLFVDRVKVSNERISLATNFIH
jgi:hypothetical protein